MVVGVYGGSFNPPHVVHGMIAAWLRWTGLVDEVWLVPAFRHAFDKPLGDWDRRLRACEALARTVGPFVRVDPIEAELPTPSFTIQTLDALHARHPDVRLRLVVGADVLGQTHQWREWARIESTYDPIAVGRAGCPPVPTAPTFPDVSSSEIRKRMDAGEPVDHLLPADVLAVWR
jgi:nicotinate-nucleotide adenylyltransferase